MIKKHPGHPEFLGQLGRKSFECHFGADASNIAKADGEQAFSAEATA
jgi:hypothetical protein